MSVMLDDTAMNARADVSIIVRLSYLSSLLSCTPLDNIWLSGNPQHSPILTVYNDLQWFDSAGGK